MNDEARNACINCKWSNDYGTKEFYFCQSESTRIFDPVSGWVAQPCREIRGAFPLTCPNFEEGKVKP